MAKNDTWKGSRLRCVLFSGKQPEEIRSELLDMIAQAGIDDCRIEIDQDNFIYYPQGIKKSKEYRFSDPGDLIDETKRKEMVKWWLGKDETEKQTPNWDFVCTAKINGKDGLILVEAKAHRGEFYYKNSCGAGKESRKEISQALGEIQEALANDFPEMSFEMDYSYQLSNRIAWAVKLAEIGIPTVLIYLGFLNCPEMDHGNYKILETSEYWKKLVLNYPGKKTRGTWASIPAEFWNSKIKIGDTSFIPIIASMDIQPEGIIKK